jgi:UV DNA damage endonuclease
MIFDPDLPRLGLCCLTHGPDHKTKFRTVRKGWAEDNSAVITSRLVEVWDHNLTELCKILRFCSAHGIWCYRISSDMFPLADLSPYDRTWAAYKQAPNKFVVQARAQIKSFVDAGGRLSTHPGQFCVITSNKADVTHRSMLNLELHSDFFDLLEIPPGYFHPINIHLSNGKLGAPGAINAARALEGASNNLRARLVFETEDKSFWTWQQIVRHFPDVPVTLDYHHRNINNLGEPEQEAHDACVATWKNTRPLFHYTEGSKHALDRSHADLITKLPTYRNIDMEIEAKHKEQAVLRGLKWLNS